MNPSTEINDKVSARSPKPASDTILDEKIEIVNPGDIASPGSDDAPPVPWFSKEEEEKVIRKLDWNIIPLIFVLYSLSVLDRSNLGNARIAGMEKDINIGGGRYAWLGTIFYIGYILSQWTCLGWKAFPPHVWVAIVVFAWGLISTLQSTCTSWGGLMACRFMLAVAEAMYAPGIPLYLSYFYPRERIGVRIGFYLAGSAAANAYGGALAYGISQARGSIGPWRILFIVEGVPTCLLAIVAFFFLPDSPAKCRFLNDREKEIAIDFSLRQPGDRSHSGLRLKQVFGALLDIRSYPPLFMYFGCNVCYGSLPLFIPTIISQLGEFNTIQSNGLSAPPYLMTYIIMTSVSYISDRTRLRGPFIAGAAAVSMVGYICLGTGTKVAVRYFGIMLTPVVFTSASIILSWVANTHSTDSKRAGALTMLATAGQCGPVLGTNVFPPRDAPYYRKGMWISCGGCVLVIIGAFIQMIILGLANRKKDKLYGKDRDTTYLDDSTEMGNDERFKYLL